jgi:crotonobetainyl-CoA:carnitine CoA-transferase CaiB-like acyl-CoA transferase
LRRALGDPAWARDPALAHHAGRMAAHDRIDAELSAWAAARELEAAVDTLVAHGVPAAGVFDGRLGSEHPQHVARGFYESVDHPAVGRQPITTVPFRFASQKSWLHCAAPTVGQHNREILRDIVGLPDAEIDALEAEGVIGTRPKGV